MKLHKRAALIAFLLAIPFVVAGLSAWFEGRAHYYEGPYGVEASQFAFMVFSLGSPLTLIVLKFHLYSGRFLQMTDDWWAMPLVVLLFIVQWVGWSQLLVLFARTIVSRTNRKNKSPSYS
jgi:hypothetical protein